ncbi:MAG: hemerythrin domain-containing protein [Candidatus Sulfotelmatobacter sp.]
MPVQIGAQSHSFSDPTGLLSDCHRRIEMFLGTLERVASVIDRPLTEETRPALESALRYFREAAPKHTADEEASLFPRLRHTHHPDIENAMERLELLEQDHVMAGSLHAEVEPLGQRYLSTGSLEAAGVEAFRKAIARLVSIYKQHISIEDELVFPLAARLLSSAEKAAIADEMAARREMKMITANRHRA